MNPATKGTGTAALFAAGVIVPLVWALKQFAHIEIPDVVASTEQAALTVLLAYFVHDKAAT